MPGGVEIIEVIEEVMQTEDAKASAYLETMHDISDHDDLESGEIADH